MSMHGSGVLHLLPSVVPCGYQRFAEQVILEALVMMTIATQLQVLTITMPLGREDIEEEERAFEKVVATFQQYASYAVRP